MNSANELHILPAKAALPADDAFRDAVRSLLSNLQWDNGHGIPASHATMKAATAVRAMMEAGR